MSDLTFQPVELYNLDTDPSEKWNMAVVYPEIAASLLEQMKAIHTNVNGPYSREAGFINELLSY